MGRRLWWLAGVGLFIAAAVLFWWSSSDDEVSSVDTATTASTSADDDVPRLKFDRKPSGWDAPLEAKGERVLTGRVLDEKGAPVSNATVTATTLHGDDVLSDQQCKCDNECGQKLLECGCPEASGQLVEHVSSRTGEAQPLARATTDATGTFTLRGLQSGSVALWADAPGSIGFRPTANVGDTTADIRMEKGRMIKGKVADGRDQPVGSALVTAIYASHSRFFDATSSADGTFEIGPVPVAGTVAVVGMKDGLMPDSAHARARSGDDLWGDAPEVLTLSLHEPRTLSGVVLREGQPVGAGVEVKVEGEHKKKKALTNEQGVFAARGLRPGSYEVKASDHGDLANVKAKVERTVDKEGVRLELTRGAFVRGTVRDSEGNPVVGASIAGWTRGEGSLRAKSNATGEYETPAGAPGEWKFRASAAGYLSQTVTQTLADDARLNFVLSGAVAVRGAVFDESGAPIDGAQVSASLPGDEKSDEPGTSDSSRSVDGGTFALDELRPGAFELLSVADGFKPTALTVKAPAENLRIVLATGAVVTGTVTEVDGRPVVGARLIATVEAGDARPEVDPGLHRRSESKSNELGRFEIRGLDKGKYRITASLLVRKPDYRMRGRVASVVVELAEKGTVETKIAFPRTRQISGTVTDEAGAPLDAARIDAMPIASKSEGEQEYSSGTADADAKGQFVLDGLYEGSFMLSASKMGFTFGKPLKVRAGQTDVRIVLKAAPHVVGRVVSEDGAPIKEFTVNRQPKVAEDGRFSVPVMGKGEGFLDVEADGYAQLRTKLPAFTGKKDVGDITLSRGRSLEGTVVNLVTGVPVVGALVDVSTQQVKDDSFYLSERMGAVATDGKGRFHLPRVDPKAVAVFATHDDFISLVQPLDSQQQNVTLSLDPGAAVEITVLDRAGKAVEGMVMTVPRLDYVSPDDTTGKYLAKGLRPGVARFQFYSESNRGAHFRPLEVTVKGRETQKVVWKEATDGATVTLELTGGDVAQFSGYLLRGRENATLPYRKMWEGGHETVQMKAGVFERVLAGGYTLVLVETTTNDFARLPVDVTAEPVQTLTVSVPAKLESVGELMAEDGE